MRSVAGSAAAASGQSQAGSERHQGGGGDEADVTDIVDAVG